ncbi:MAG: SDR family oxidoreductase [Planctomycetia bacterium]|nr:SDR family oxidoreductase [Planctomycetia bacterium]
MTTTADPFFSLKDKVALVTGAGQGIGAAIARRLAAAGARVGVLDLRGDAAGAVASEIGGVPLVGDVTREFDIASALAHLAAEAGPVDVLVNNAGIIGKVGPIAEISRSDLEQVLTINLVGPFLLSRAALPAMIARKYGRIVNVASIAGKEGNPNLIPYSVSKAGLIALTKALAKEVAGHGDITINSISPAVIHTPMMDALSPATRDYMVSRVPLGRPGTSEEVAALVHYLASSDASFTTGQCYDISGGRATY